MHLFMSQKSSINLIEKIISLVGSDSGSTKKSSIHLLETIISYVGSGSGSTNLPSASRCDSATLVGDERCDW